MDFVSIMSQVMSNNVVTPIEYNVKCGKCGNGFGYNLDFPHYIETTLGYTQPTKVITKLDPVTNIEYEFDLGLPMAKDITEISLLTQMGKIDKQLTDLFLPVTYIRGIKINGEVVDGYRTESILDRIALFSDSVSPSIFIGVDSITDDISAMLDLPEFFGVNCPGCGSVVTGLISVDTFFLT